MSDVVVRQPERPFLTARWTELVMLNFAVPTGVIARLAPPGTEPDLVGNQSFVSVVGFRFHHTRVWGVPWPGHTRFEEVNLRYYVRRDVNGEVRRGVGFVQEVVPRRMVAFIANRFYNECYVARPMQSDIRVADRELATGDTVEYRWQSGRRRRWLGARRERARWNRIGARVAGGLHLPPPDSFEKFFVEHYWGYSRAPDGATVEYRVVHKPWRVAPVDDVVWDFDLAAACETPLAQHLAAPPNSALVADGSTVEVYRGRRIIQPVRPEPQSIAPAIAKP